MQTNVVRRNAGPAPRYTSYPTAPQFSAAVGPADYAAWLGRLPAASRLSLYLHIHFCRELCWYCACTTRGTRRYGPVAGYLETLTGEIASVASRLPEGPAVTHIHWGGGSPSMLRPDDIGRISRALRSTFAIRPDAEHAVEIDPRDLPEATVGAFVAAGVSRVSIGVQDFDPAVQAAINRHQSFAETERAVEAFRARGVASINIDLVYGLPRQTAESAQATIERVLSLRPDRLAVFGYAHVPAKARPQRLIDESCLPGPEERIRQLESIASCLTDAGYVAVGIDHFARPGDRLALGPVRRNFQGYTTDDSDAIIGLGASAIGRLPEGYVQNAVAVADYARQIRESGLATAKGCRLTADDRMRGHVIERLMCDFSFSRSALLARFGQAAAPLLGEIEALIAADEDRFVEETEDGFRCTASGRTFVRRLCSRFDAYWREGSATHSPAV